MVERMDVIEGREAHVLAANTDATHHARFDLDVMASFSRLQLAAALIGPFLLYPSSYC
jgi:hypothetical protein